MAARCRQFRGDKHDECHTNPIDVFFGRQTELLLPLFHATGHRPNLLTTYGVLGKALALHGLWTGSVARWLAGSYVAYLFDCMDGQYARAYHMVSRNGDLYDHATDTLFFTAVVVIVATRYRGVLRPGDAGVVILLMALVSVHSGCQQRAYKPEARRRHNEEVRKESLDLMPPSGRPHPLSLPLPRAGGRGCVRGMMMMGGPEHPSCLCPDDDGRASLRWSRLVGHGTFTLLVTLLVAAIMLRAPRAA